MIGFRMPTRVHIAPGCLARLPEVARSLELESLAGPTFGFGELDVGVFTNPIPFAAMMSSGTETELPDGTVDAELLSGLVDFVDRSFDPPSQLPPFTYVEAGIVSTSSTFTVPEPGGVVSIVTAWTTLGFLALRVRRRPPRSRGRGTRRAEPACRRSILPRCRRVPT